MRVALKFGYIGSSFYGYQRQKGVRTVEGEIISACTQIGAFAGPSQARFQSASRTDRGVHAAGNVVAFDTEFEPQELITALNSLSRDILFHSYLQVPAAFNPRRARMRHYRYFLCTEVDRRMLGASLERFVGTRDFSRFAKGKGAGAVRNVESIELHEKNGFLAIDIKGKGFLRNMVRRIVAAGVAVASGERSIEEIDRAIAGGDVKSFGLAPAEFLVLMDVDYGMHFNRVGLHEKTLRRWDEMAWRMKLLSMLGMHLTGKERL